MSQAERIIKVREYLKERNIDALLIYNHEEKKPALALRYLTGFTGTSGAAFLTHEKTFFLTDSRYTVQAQTEVQGCETHSFNPFWPGFWGFLNRNSVLRLALLKDRTSWDFVLKIQEKVNPLPELVPLPDITQQLRAVKDADEIAKIRKAVEIIENALTQVYPLVRPGVAELALNRALRDVLLDGVEFSFPSIIASGKRSAMPHGLASDKVVERGDIVQFDVGCVVDGYVSDISRVAVVGKATKKQKAMHRAVTHAIDEAVPLYRPGVAACEAHECAQQIIRSHGFPEFGHGLGHGMGLDVHESPGVALSSKDIFQEKNVVTIEPGIYEEGYGGMRVERDVLITENGPEYLDTLTTDLLEL